MFPKTIYCVHSPCSPLRAIVTIASTNENDVSAIVKKIDPKNKIRYEANAIQKPAVIHKVIVNNTATTDK